MKYVQKDRQKGKRPHAVEAWRAAELVRTAASSSGLLPLQVRDAISSGKVAFTKRGVEVTRAGEKFVLRKDDMLVFDDKLGVYGATAAEIDKEFRPDALFGR